MEADNILGLVSAVASYLNENQAAGGGSRAPSASSASRGRPTTALAGAAARASSSQKRSGALPEDIIAIVQTLPILVSQLRGKLQRWQGEKESLVKELSDTRAVLREMTELCAAQREKIVNLQEVAESAKAAAAEAHSLAQAPAARTVVFAGGATARQPYTLPRVELQLPGGPVAGPSTGATVVSGHGKQPLQQGTPVTSAPAQATVSQPPQQQQLQQQLHAHRACLVTEYSVVSFSREPQQPVAQAAQAAASSSPQVAASAPAPEAPTPASPTKATTPLAPKDENIPPAASSSKASLAASSSEHVNQELKEAEARGLALQKQLEGTRADNRYLQEKAARLQAVITSLEGVVAAQRQAMTELSDKADSRRNERLALLRGAVEAASASATAASAAAVVRQQKQRQLEEERRRLMAEVDDDDADIGHGTRTGRPSEVSPPASAFPVRDRSREYQPHHQQHNHQQRPQKVYEEEDDFSYEQSSGSEEDGEVEEGGAASGDDDDREAHNVSGADADEGGADGDVEDHGRHHHDHQADDDEGDLSYEERDHHHGDDGHGVEEGEDTEAVRPHQFSGPSPASGSTTSMMTPPASAGGPGISARLGLPPRSPHMHSGGSGSGGSMRGAGGGLR